MDGTGHVSERVGPRALGAVAEAKASLQILPLKATGRSVAKQAIFGAKPTRKTQRVSVTVTWAEQVHQHAVEGNAFVISVARDSVDLQRARRALSKARQQL